MRSLDTIFKKKFRIQLEESWGVEKSEGKTRDRVWYEEILLRRDAGFIYLYSLNPTILACFTTRTKLAQALAQEYPDTQLMEMEGESLLKFPAKDAIAIATRLGARQRRQMTEEQKEKVKEHFAQLRTEGKVPTRQKTATI
jgi:hypothetical protein